MLDQVCARRDAAELFVGLACKAMQGFGKLWVLACIVVLSGCAAPVPDYEITSEMSVSDPHFTHTIASLMNSPVMPGNDVQTLLNGDEIFPAMLEAIHAAEHTVTFETYVYWSGDIGQAFTDALCDRAKAGVQVDVIIDAVGSANIDDGYVGQLEDAGVRVVLYHRLRWIYFVNIAKAPSLNYRTHRKLLVCDGKVGFIGGVGIADEWLGDAQNALHWRDNHYKVEGPVVAQLQATFMDNWMETTGQVPTGEHYFPKLETKGDLPVQLFMSSPESGGARNMQLMYLLFIASARESLWLCTPYFVLDQQSHEALIAAKQRGVDVKILVPRKIDMPLVRHASRAGWGPLLEAGIEIYEYTPTMLHTKLMIVDGLWTSIGSANLDNRSFKFNDEANINVRDEAFADVQRQAFKDDLMKSQRITLETYDDRPWNVKLWDTLMMPLRPQL